MSFSDADVAWLEELLREAATREIMPRFRRLDSGDVRTKKSAADLVTDADVNAERLITAALLQRWPDALVVGEEAVSADPSRLRGLGEAELGFAIDPVDGTFNFAMGVPLFGVMLAVTRRGETVAGLIHDPVGDDTLIAVRGAGAHVLTRGGGRQACAVAGPVPLSQMTGGISWQFLSPPDRFTLSRNHAKCLSQFGYRCAAAEYRLLATGGAHFAVYSKLDPWDHLAGALIHAEAGGHVARFDGSAYLPSHVEGGLIVAPDPDSWSEIRRELWATD